MSLNPLFSLFRFHVRRQWQMQPLAFTILCVSTLAVSGAMAIYIHAWEEQETVEGAWHTIVDERPTTAHVAPEVPKSQMVLPAFRSKHLVEALDRAAREAQLPLDEIQFALEDNGNQPYLRYWATLTVSSGYPAIRRFLDRLRDELVALSIDAISCSRADIGATGVTCELAVSAFYRRGEHG